MPTASRPRPSTTWSHGLTRIGDALDEGRQAGRQAFLQAARAPFRDSLLGLRRREEEDRARPRQAFAAAERLPMRSADGAAVGERDRSSGRESPSAARRRRSCRHRPPACRPRAAQLVIAQSLVVAAEGSSAKSRLRAEVRPSVDAACAQAASCAEAKSQTIRRLARRARNEHRARAEEAVVGEEVVDQERGDEERPQQRNQRFVLAAIERDPRCSEDSGCRSPASARRCGAASRNPRGPRESARARHSSAIGR